MYRAILGLMLVITVCSAALGQQTSDATHITTTSWHGLSGLFVTPTARLIGRGNLAMGFNESKHTEHRNGGQFTDRQIRGVITYGVADWLEIYAAHHNNMYVIDAGPTLSNQSFNTVGFKVRLMREHPHFWFPEVSLGVRDITNDTRDVGPFEDVNNGRKLYLLATKRVFQSRPLGRWMDMNVGMTWDECTITGLIGLELTIAPNASLIAEWMWDSPYLNFKDYGQPNRCGRFIFDPGIRFYPYQVPDLALDLGFVGDGEFEFSFAASYVVRL